MFIQLTNKEVELLEFLLDNKNDVVQDGDIDFKSIDDLIVTLRSIQNSDVHLNDNLYAKLFELTDNECFDIHDAIASYTLHRKATRLTITTATDINIDSLKVAFEKNKASIMLNKHVKPYIFLVNCDPK